MPVTHSTVAYTNTRSAQSAVVRLRDCVIESAEVDVSDGITPVGSTTMLPGVAFEQVDDSAQLLSMGRGTC